MGSTKRKLNKKPSKTTKNKRGGMLMTNKETDLINHHICEVRPGAVRDSPGLEIFTSVSMSFRVDNVSIPYIQQNYKSSNDRWFKFVIINNDGIEHIYAIDGGKINKHSVCMLQGILDVTKQKGEYNELRDAVKSLYLFKLTYGNDRTTFNEDMIKECNELIERINQLIKEDTNLECMPVISAGSASINDDDTICINAKSGHYKPTPFSMERAREIIQQITGIATTIRTKVEERILIERYGENADKFTGICL